MTYAQCNILNRALRIRHSSTASRQVTPHHPPPSCFSRKSTPSPSRQPLCISLPAGAPVFPSPFLSRAAEPRSRRAAVFPPPHVLLTQPPAILRHRPDLPNPILRPVRPPGQRLRPVQRDLPLQRRPEGMSPSAVGNDGCGCKRAQIKPLSQRTIPSKKQSGCLFSLMLKYLIEIILWLLNRR